MTLRSGTLVALFVAAGLAFLITENADQQNGDIPLLVLVIAALRSARARRVVAGEVSGYGSCCPGSSSRWRCRSAMPMRSPAAMTLTPWRC
jgi:hypothetical protein